MSVLPPVLNGGLHVSCTAPAVRLGVDLRSSGGVGGPEGVTDCTSDGLKAQIHKHTHFFSKKTVGSVNSSSQEHSPEHGPELGSVSAR